MRAFLKKLFVFCILLSSCCLFVLFIPSTFYTVSKNHYDYQQVKIIEKLKTDHRKKIVFVGGSNLGFGLFANMVQDSLSITCYNLGVHASFGMQRILELLRNNVNDQDLIVIVPEFENYDFQKFGEERYFLDYLIYGNVIQGNSSIKDVVLSLKLNFPRLIKLAAIQTNLYHIDPNAYSLKRFNINGDYITKGTIAIRRAKFSHASRINQSTLLSMKSEIEGAFPTLNYVIMSPVSHKIRFSFKEKSAYENNMIQVFGAKYLGKADSFEYEFEEFFDTEYHLKDSSRTDRTITMIRLLKPLVRNNE